MSVPHPPGYLAGGPRRPMRITHESIYISIYICSRSCLATLPGNFGESVRFHRSMYSAVEKGFPSCFAKGRNSQAGDCQGVLSATRSFLVGSLRESSFSRRIPTHPSGPVSPEFRQAAHHCAPSPIGFSSRSQLYHHISILVPPFIRCRRRPAGGRKPSSSLSTS